MCFGQVEIEERSRMSRILFTDIDGTLLKHDRSMSEVTKHAIDCLLEKNNVFVLASGRSINSMESVAKRLQFHRKNCYAICYNGAQVLDLYSGERRFSLSIPTLYVDYVVRKAREYGFTILMYEDEGVVAETTSEIIKNRYISQNIGFRISDLTKDPNTNRLKIVIADPGKHDNLELFRENVSREIGNILDLYFSSMDYLEVVLKGVNKGKALNEICNFLEFSKDDSISVGDEENDIPMIIEAKVGCAVANATEEVKKVADFITENDCDHDGIVEVIEKFIL